MATSRPRTVILDLRAIERGPRSREILSNLQKIEGWVFPDSDKDVPDRSVIETLLVQYWAFQGRAAFLGSIIFDPTGPFDPLADLPEPDFP